MNPIDSAPIRSFDQWIHADTVASGLAILVLVITIGLFLGAIRVRKIGLGIPGVLFSLYFWAVWLEHRSEDPAVFDGFCVDPVHVFDWAAGGAEFCEFAADGGAAAESFGGGGADIGGVDVGVVRGGGGAVGGAGLICGGVYDDARAGGCAGSFSNDPHRGTEGAGSCGSESRGGGAGSADGVGVFDYLSVWGHRAGVGDSAGEAHAGDQVAG